jgi:hypothetical protein
MLPGKRRLPGTGSPDQHHKTQFWNFDFHEKTLFAFGDQGALFEKTAPWTPAKTFY